MHQGTRLIEMQYGLVRNGNGEGVVMLQFLDIGSEQEEDMNFGFQVIGNKDAVDIFGYLAIGAVGRNAIPLMRDQHIKKASRYSRGFFSSALSLSFNLLFLLHVSLLSFHALFHV